MLSKSDYAFSLRVVIGQFDKLGMVLVGCGGTGSWLAPIVARTARLLKDLRGVEVEVVFIDPDKVGPENIYRQNFCDAEIGMFKAEALATRYSAAWGMDIKALNSKFRRIESSGLNVILGCVDNFAARIEIDRSREFVRNTWWIDCGNEHSYGQVVIGHGSRPRDNATFEDITTWLPWPSDRNPDMLKEQKGIAKSSTSNLSCAELAMLNSQGMSINTMMASIAGDYLTRLLITKDLRKMETVIDLESGTAQSVYITKEKLTLVKKTSNHNNR